MACVLVCGFYTVDWLLCGVHVCRVSFINAYCTMQSVLWLCVPTFGTSGFWRELNSVLHVCIVYFVYCIYCIIIRMYCTPYCTHTYYIYTAHDNAPPCLDCMQSMYVCVYDG